MRFLPSELPSGHDVWPRGRHTISPPTSNRDEAAQRSNTVHLSHPCSSIVTEWLLQIKDASTQKGRRQQNSRCSESEARRRTKLRLRRSRRCLFHESRLPRSITDLPSFVNLNSFTKRSYSVRDRALTAHPFASRRSAAPTLTYQR